jgi:hypothetical protein
MGGICPNQQRSISGRGFVDCGVWVDASESRGEVGDREGGAVRLLENGGGRSNSQCGLTVQQINEVIIGLVGCGGLGNQKWGNADNRGFHRFIHDFRERTARGNCFTQDFLSLFSCLVDAAVAASLP